MSKWIPLHNEVSPAVGKMNWSAAWKVFVYHDHPDRTYDYDIKAFINRHVNPQSVFQPYPLITRDSRGMDEEPSGCQVSIAATKGGELWKGDDGRTAHQRDWDFLTELKDRILRECSVKDSADTVEKVKALAEYVHTHRGEVYESRHPVDTMIHTSYCDGVANAMAALASVMGLRNRTINTTTHSTVEVEIDGKWYWIENYSKELRSLGPAFHSSSIMELSINPENCVELRGNKEVKKRLIVYKLSGDDCLRFGSVYSLASGLWHFNQGGFGRDKYVRCQTLLNGAGLTVGLDGNTAKALYPDMKECLFKATDSGAMLVAGKYCWWYSALPLKKGNRVRRVFYLGRLNDPANPVSKIETHLLLAPVMPINFPSDGGDWYLKVNDRVHMLKQNDIEWKIEKIEHRLDEKLIPNPAGIEKMLEERIRFILPVSDLKENSLNSIEFGSDKYGESHLNIMISPDPVLPYHSPYFSANGGGPKGKWTIKPDHICEVLKVRGFEYA